MVPAALAGRTLVLLQRGAERASAPTTNAAFAHCRPPYSLRPQSGCAVRRESLSGAARRLKDGVALCAPAVTSPAGEIEDSARHFPGFLGLFA
ncbi:MAG: hypothetical protein M5R42_16965 [Rhodocyclaceae bacterium]|nr:hypothetical protein [Rhodocyclaceae bacterium]